MRFFVKIQMDSLKLISPSPGSRAVRRKLIAKRIIVKTRAPSGIVIFQRGDGHTMHAGMTRAATQHAITMI